MIVLSYKCSICQREVDPGIEIQWVHENDRTPICAGAKVLRSTLCGFEKRLRKDGNPEK